MNALSRDFRSAWRSLWRNPRTSTVAILTLALGIGANAAIFTLINAVVLRPLPVPHPEQLVALSTTIADNVNGDEPFTLPMFEELSRRQEVFTQIFAWYSGGIETFQADGHYVTASLAQVSGNYYEAMSVAPLLGRYIQPRDVALGSGVSQPVAVISYRAWRNWYHGAADIIGRTIQMRDHRAFTVVGVEPEGYSGLIIDGSTDVTIPILAIAGVANTDLHDRRILWLRLYGRMKPAMTLARTRASIALLWPRVLEATFPPGFEGEKRTRFFARRIKLEPAGTGVSFLRKRFSDTLRVLLALVAVVLLIACLNLANLMLARSAARRHEWGVRTALGASAWGLVRQPLIESLLLSLTGAAFGLVVAYWASRALLQIAWTGLVPASLSTSPDARVLAFTVAVAVASAVVFAAAPAWSASGVRPIDALRKQTRSVRGGVTAAGKSLLVLQIALSLMLVAGALMFARTLSRLHKVDLGYRRDHLLTLMLFPQPGQEAMPNTAEYYRQLAERMRAIPGVDAVSFSGNGPTNEPEDFEQVYRSLSEAPAEAVHDFVAPDFFRAMGMHVIRGREFNWRDDQHDPQTAIVSQSLAEKLFGDADPVGRTIYFGKHARAVALKIVGEVNSASLWNIESAQPLAIYQPESQDYPDAQPLMDIRTTVDPRSIKTQAERVVRSQGYQYSLRTQTLDERLDSYMSVQRLTALVAGFFGAVALLIAAIGIYGLMSFHLARRTAELGIRVALGAQRRQVLSMVLREILGMAGAGCALGLAATWFAAKLIRSILFGVSATDPVILATAALVLFAVAITAGFIPARRAASIDPVTALRVE